MKSSEIWKAANEKLVFVGVLFTWLQDDPQNPLIGVWAGKLKKMLPCFIGIDPEKKALIFQSEDDGIVGISMNRIDENSISLYMETDLVLENWIMENAGRTSAGELAGVFLFGKRRMEWAVRQQWSGGESLSGICARHLTIRGKS